MKATLLEPNYLDILKFKLQNKYGYPQYFFEFFEFQGKINVALLKQSFSIALDSLEKINYKIIQNCDSVVYIPHPSSNPFFSKRTLPNLLMETFIATLENQAAQLIKECKNAPFIFYHYHDGRGRHLMVLWINHVYADADSGYFVFKNIVKTYNKLLIGEIPAIEARQYVSDETIIQQWVKPKSVLNRSIQKIRSLLFILYTISYQRKASQIDSIYHDGYQHDSVKYRYFSIPKVSKQFRLDSQVTANTVISSLLIKAFYEIKKPRLSSGVFFAMPVNVRKEMALSPFPFGNHVTIMSIRVKYPHKNIHVIMKTISQQAKFQKYCKFSQKSYEFSVFLNEKGKSDRLLEAFCKGSSLHHFYISNYGQYNKEDDPELCFEKCKLIQSGGLNFPLQSHFGLIFTIVPNKDSIVIGISSSSKILNHTELSEMINLVKKEAYFYMGNGVA